MTPKALPPELPQSPTASRRTRISWDAEGWELGFQAPGVSLPHHTVQLALLPALPCHLRSILTSQDALSASRYDTFWSPPPPVPSPEKYKPQAPIHLLSPTKPCPLTQLGQFLHHVLVLLECLPCLPPPLPPAVYFAGVLGGTSLQSRDP